MSDSVLLDCCLDLMRRLPPQNIEKNLSAMIDLTPPDMLPDLLSSIDQTLKASRCTLTERQYLICDYNRDGDSYRSPWSNTYNPPLEDGTLPSPELRKLEVLCNTAFDRYRELYFCGGTSSCYLWDIDSSTFAGVVLIKKAAGQGSETVKGCWDSIHVFEVDPQKTNSTYKLTSTIMLWLQTEKSNTTLQLGGSLTRQSEASYPLKNYEDHVGNIGQAIEDMESNMRMTMSNIYFDKTKQIINSIRSITTAAENEKHKLLQTDLASKIMARQQK